MGLFTRAAELPAPRPSRVPVLAEQPGAAPPGEAARAAWRGSHPGLCCCRAR